MSDVPVRYIYMLISRAKETYKVPYETHPADRLRQCVFGGSSNTMDFLPLDRSGNRRFLPIMVHPEKAEVHILEDEAASRAFVDMMWAEAMFIYGRMIEIYLVTSVAPIPMATMCNREWGQMGQNYLRSLLALGFQAFLIIVCVAIYAALVGHIAVSDDISYAIWTCMGYTVLLCFCLFKTGSMAKSVFNSH